MSKQYFGLGLEVELLSTTEDGARNYRARFNVNESDRIRIIEVEEPSVVENFQFNEEGQYITFTIPRHIEYARLAINYTSENTETGLQLKHTTYLEL